MRTSIVRDVMPGGLTYVSKLPLWYRQQVFLRRYNLKADIFNLLTHPRYLKLMTKCHRWVTVLMCKVLRCFWMLWQFFILYMWLCLCADCLTLEDVTDRLSRNVGKRILTHVAITILNRKDKTYSTFITNRKDGAAWETYVYVGE
jgi:hypothetical protein